MGSFFQRKRVRQFMTAFKWCRVAVLLVVLVAVVAVAYLQLVGLPTLLKNPLLRALREHGFNAQFTSARLGWGPAIVVQNASFNRTNDDNGARLTAGWTELNLNDAAILRGRFQVDSFVVRDAAVRIPSDATNGEPILLTNVDFRVTVRTNDVAVVKDCSGWCDGIHIHLNGEIHNFFSMRHWAVPAASVPVPRETGHAQPAPSGQRITAWEIYKKIHFSETPELNLNFYADGRDRNSLRTDLRFSAASAKSSWGQCGPLHIRAVGARLFDSGDRPFLQVRVTADNVDTLWAKSRNLALIVDFSRAAHTNYSAEIHMTARNVSTEWSTTAGSHWAKLKELRWDGDATLPSTTFIPRIAHGILRASDTETELGSAGAASLGVDVRRLDDSSPANPAWGQWNNAKPYALDWKADVTDIQTPKLKLDHIDFKGAWLAPTLTIENLEANMYHGHLKAGAVLDVGLREVHALAAVDFDPHQVSAVLTGPARHWISLYDWKTPPNLSASMRFVLPPWTNRMDAWPDESRDSMQLAGDFSIKQGSFRGIAVNAAQAHYTYTNRVWNVTGLRVAGDGGSLDLDYTWSEWTHDYHFRFDSKLDPAIAVSLLTERQQLALGEVSFPEKPELTGQAWGNWSAPDSIGLSAALSTGQILVRGEKVDQLSAQLDLTNRYLRVSQLALAAGSGHVAVSLAGVDFASGVISMTNAVSTIDPEMVHRALGKFAPPFMKEVHFDSAPEVKAYGSFCPGDDLGTDMHFAIQGNRFHWNHISAESAQGKVDFQLRTVSVTNVTAALYKTGTLDGWITFAWEPHGSEPSFNSDFNVKNLNLESLTREFDPKRTKKIEGMLNGHLSLFAPAPARPTNFFGHGWLHVYDGLLWDFKIFGILSPILNAIAPGAGNSRAREALASFTITNGVLATDDLEIRSSGFRILYRGTVDTQERLNAKVEANLLRDTPVMGHLLSWMLKPVDKIFEFRVTGTVRKPVTKPIFIPKLFLDLLHPFHSLKEMRPSTQSGRSPASQR